MNLASHPSLDLLFLDETLWVLHAQIGIPAYDFDLARLIASRRPWQRPPRISAVARIGAVSDYSETWTSLQRQGIELINDPSQHLRASELTDWYPRLAGMTPRSRWYEHEPRGREIENEFEWPVFVKGSRQTSRHQAELSIARSADDFDRIMQRYREDDILSWQKIVCREYVKIRTVVGETGSKVPPGFEFRTFWWHGKLVGSGRYWSEFCDYSWTQQERRDALRIADSAAAAVNVPFLVVDIAQLADGRWIVIECNDGQESGYAGVSPFAFWRDILNVEKSMRRPAIARDDSPQEDCLGND